MSESRPKDDDANPKPATDSKHEAGDAARDFFRFRPIAFLQDAIRRSQEQHGAHEQDWTEKYISVPATAIWESVGPYCTEHRVRLAAFTAVACAFLWMWWRGRLDDNTVIALFTIVMAYTTWRNWDAMRIQNEIMVRQCNQTDTVIGQMRLDRRPWVSFMAPRVQPGLLAAGHPVHWAMQMVVTGGMPAICHSAGASPFFVDNEQGITGELAKHWRTAEECNCGGGIIPPGDKAVISPKEKWQFPNNMVLDIKEGRKIWCVAVAVRYGDVTEAAYKSRSCFQFLPEQGAFIASYDPKHHDYE